MNESPYLINEMTVAFCILIIMIMNKVYMHMVHDDVHLKMPYNNIQMTLFKYNVALQKN